MELTVWKRSTETYTMEGTSWNLHHGSYFIEHSRWKNLMEPTTWKLPSGTYTMEVTSWNLHHGSYLEEHTPWKLPH